MSPASATTTIERVVAAAEHEDLARRAGVHDRSVEHERGVDAEGLRLLRDAGEPVPRESAVAPFCSSWRSRRARGSRAAASTRCRSVSASSTVPKLREAASGAIEVDVRSGRVAAGRVAGLRTLRAVRGDAGAARRAAAVTAATAAGDVCDSQRRDRRRRARPPRPRRTSRAAVAAPRGRPRDRRRRCGSQRAGDEHVAVSRRERGDRDRVARGRERVAPLVDAGSAVEQLARDRGRVPVVAGGRVECAVELGAQQLVHELGGEGFHRGGHRVRFVGRSEGALTVPERIRERGAAPCDARPHGAGAGCRARSRSRRSPARPGRAARPRPGTPRAASRGRRRRRARPRPVRRSRVRSTPLPARRRRRGDAAAAAGIRRARRSSRPGSTTWRTAARPSNDAMPRAIAISASWVASSASWSLPRIRRQTACTRSTWRARRASTRAAFAASGRGREIAVASLIVRRGHREQAGGLSPLRSRRCRGRGVRCAHRSPARCCRRRCRPRAPAGGGAPGTRRRPGAPACSTAICSTPCSGTRSMMKRKALLRVRTFPASSTAPSTTEMIGLIESIEPRSARAPPMRPPLRRYSSVSSAARTRWWSRSVLDVRDDRGQVRAVGRASRGAEHEVADAHRRALRVDDRDRAQAVERLGRDLRGLHRRRQLRGEVDADDAVRAGVGELAEGLFERTHRRCGGLGEHGGLLELAPEVGGAQLLAVDVLLVTEADREGDDLDPELVAGFLREVRSAVGDDANDHQSSWDVLVGVPRRRGG